MEDFVSSLVKDIASAAAIVLVIAIVSYTITGTWPVAVAVESGSMEPHIQKGDIVFLLGTDRTKIITYQEGREISYTSFNNYGDVIVYKPNGLSSRTPIIHRAMKWVKKGEMMPGGVPAPHEGYITKGDHNSGYDQPYIEPVKPDWIIGVAKARIPLLGYVRLIFSVVLSPCLLTFRAPEEPSFTLICAPQLP
ncbi:MAG: signal peptidase I [Candidatus Syntropharchaeia archaeon]